ncbi:unnamed protein product [Schistosoma curassoni]|uniref:Noggin n=1 Tax=Schistosoma curassoni TaxID=6186 RepID=A0A183KUU3_9TREM|nr:unnamed protein product [Schistosoma curassoni]VDP67155.1 unnamed protein product [Schistosoma curassoni]
MTTFQLYTLLFVLFYCNEPFIGPNYYFITQVIAITDMKSKYTDKSFNLHTSNVQSDNTVNDDPSYNNNNNNNIQTMSKSSFKNKSHSPLSTSTNFLYNISNPVERNFKLTNQVGGLGLVSSVQNRISLDTLSHTTNSPLNIIKHNSPVLSNSLISSIDDMKRYKNNQPITDWPTSLASEEYSKINMRIMGQPIDPSVVNHLHPDVSPHKIKKLRKILSGSLDKEWTSETPPRVLRQRGISGSFNTNNQESYTSLDAKLLKEIRELNFTFRNSYGVYFTLTDEQIQPYRYWLIERATCEMDFIWEDLGPLFWPRWIRRGVCLNRPGHSCSWPSGMKCRPSGSRALQLLHWKCEDAAQVQTREHAADQRIRRRVSMNTFHSGFYEMEPVTDIIKSKHKRDTYARLSLKDNSLQHINSYRKLQARNLGNSHYDTKTSWTNIKSSEPSILSSSSSSSISSSSSSLHLDTNSKDEKRRRRARRLIKRLSVTANGYHCYWQVQKYLISDRCSCSCS